MEYTYQNFRVRPWQPGDRQSVANLIEGVLAEYGLDWDPQGADRDVLEIENCYLATGGAFWCVEQAGQIVGSGGYYPIARGQAAVEMRKMYLHPWVRGQGLGKFLLNLLEDEIRQEGFREIWVETSSLLWEAVLFYEGQGYQPSTGVETARCDRVYLKKL
jgi:putative acetyltransferase